MSAERRAILELLARRDDGKTICPSEAAREVGGAEYRGRMDAVRDAARELVAGRYLLEEDVDLVTTDAVRRYDESPTGAETGRR